MIVGQDDASAAMLRGVGDDVPQRKGRSSLIARMTRQVHATGLLIHMCDPQAFAGGIRIRHAAGEKLACRRQAVELER